MKMSKYSVYLGVYPILLCWLLNHKHKSYYTIGLLSSITNHFTRDFFKKKNEKYHTMFVFFDRFILFYGLLFIENKQYKIIKYITSIIYLSSKLLFLKEHKENLHVLVHALISGYILIQISNNKNKIN